MAADMRISGAVAIVLCDAIVDAVDNGTAATAGLTEIRTGAAPATCETASSGTLLVSINFSSTAFGNASDQNPGAAASVSGTPSNTSATASGTAAHYRVYDQDTGPTCVWQNSAGGASSGEGMELSNANIATGQAVSITSWTVTVNET